MVSARVSESRQTTGVSPAGTLPFFTPLANVPPSSFQSIWNSAEKYSGWDNARRYTLNSPKEPAALPLKRTKISRPAAMTGVDPQGEQGQTATLHLISPSMRRHCTDGSIQSTHPRDDARKRVVVVK